MSVLLVTSLALTVYSYALYPVVLMGLRCVFRRRIQERAEEPCVTLLVSVFNEEAVIVKKLENCLRLDYPPELLEILVVSDGSTDGTDAAVRRFGRSGVTLLSRPERRGKTAGLNDAVAVARGDVIVFSDADAMYPPDAIRKMASSLCAPGIGLVTGSTNYVGSVGDDIAKTSGIYTRLERMTKTLESELGSCVGADGAIFAMWKSLYQPLKEDDINDFVIPLRVVRQDYRVVFRDDLLCTEKASDDAGKEFRRQIRITNRTLRALFRNADLMNVLTYPLFSFKLISHKLLRLSVPFFLILSFALNAVLFGQGTAYRGLFSCQLAFYGAALAGFLLETRHLWSWKLGLAYHFVAVNCAILLGWLAYFRGKKHVTWGTQGPTSAG